MTSAPSSSEALLAPRLMREDVVAPLRAQLAARGLVRVADAFVEAQAVRFVRALKASEHLAMQAVDPDAGFQCWRFGWQPGVGCEREDHPLCELARWLRGDGVAWGSATTGLHLAADDAVLISDRLAKGAFRDRFAANDEAPARAVACVIQLVPQSWPAAWGGHLELMSDDAEGAPATSLTPAWNAIDLIDVRRFPEWRWPLIDQHVEGHVICAGFRLADPARTTT